MSEIFHPVLDDNVFWALDVIREQLSVDPGYLDLDECTYPERFKEIFRKRKDEDGDGEEVIITSLSMDDIDLVEETKLLFTELKDAAERFSDTDHSERMSYFRTSTSLLDKLIAMKERALNVRQVSRFYSTVLAVMEEILEPEQVTQVRERLKEYVG